jgi:protein AATF/BFR2
MVPVPLVGGGWHVAQIDELFASLLGKGFGDAQPADQMMADGVAESSDSGAVGKDILKGFRLFG